MTAMILFLEPQYIKINGALIMWHKGKRRGMTQMTLFYCVAAALCVSFAIFTVDYVRSEIH